MVSRSGGNPGEEPSPRAIREQLARILDSPEFHAPERGRRFLRHIVEEALAGDASRLNAYTIAQIVFGRDASFDAQNDPVVRIEAGRIRRALERYYLVSGRQDPVLITIPKGHYAPSFDTNAPPGAAMRILPAAKTPEGKKPEAPGSRTRAMGYRDLIVPVGVPAVFGLLAILALVRPLEDYVMPSPVGERQATARGASMAIVVEPLSVLGDGNEGRDIARGLGDQLITRLSKLAGVVVVAPMAGDATPRSANAFRLQGSLSVENGSLHAHIRLVRSIDGTVAWAQQFDRAVNDRNHLDIEDEIVALIIKALSAARDAQVRSS